MKRCLVVLLLLTLVHAASINAQTPTGTIAGVDRDPSGAAVNEAKIRLRPRNQLDARCYDFSAGKL